MDTGFDCISEGIVSGIFRFKVVNQYSIFVRINNPVFPDIGRTIFKKFGEIIYSSAARRDNFNDPVGAPVQPLSVSLLLSHITLISGST